MTDPQNSSGMATGSRDMVATSKSTSVAGSGMLATSKSRERTAGEKYRIRREEKRAEQDAPKLQSAHGRRRLQRISSPKHY